MYNTMVEVLNYNKPVNGLIEKIAELEQVSMTLKTEISHLRMWIYFPKKPMKTSDQMKMAPKRKFILKPMSKS